MNDKTLILGASDQPQRTSTLALHRLQEQGHGVILVNPRLEEINGIPCYPSIEEAPQDVHTITVYVSPAISSGLKEAMLNSPAKRVIFNPGSENPELQMALEGAGKTVQEACTLVLLGTAQY